MDVPTTLYMDILAIFAFVMPSVMTMDYCQRFRLWSLDGIEAFYCPMVNPSHTNTPGRTEIYEAQPSVRTLFDRLKPALGATSSTVPGDLFHSPAAGFVPWKTSTSS